MTFKIPEDLTALDNEALEALIKEAEEVVTSVTAESSDEELDHAEKVAEFIHAAEGEIGARADAEKERNERIERIRGTAKKADEEEGGEEGGEEGDGEQTGADGEEGGEVGGGQEVVDEAEALLEEDSKQAASGKKATFTPTPRRSVTARAAGKKSEDKVPAKPKATLLAAADVPGFAAGHKFGEGKGALTAAAEAINNRLQAYPTEMVPGMQMRNGAVLIQLPENKYKQETKDVSELIMQISDEARMRSAESLLAAGGWGAPSEQTLDFCGPVTIDGLLSLPEFTLTRPGVSYTRGPQFADVLGSSTGFWDMSEATAEAGVQLKTSLRPTVPGFTEVRPDAVGVMMEAGLLLRAGWPELVERYARYAILAHQYKLNQKYLGQIHAFTGAATTINTGFQNELDILHFIELVAIGERQRNFLPENTTMEVLLPTWVRPAMRVGLAQRDGIDSITVTNAQIDGHFAARGVRVQWLRGYQDLALAAGIAVTYPDTLDFVMYPAGTYVRGVLPVIQLDTIYDSVNLKKNDYVHLFLEQGVLMTNPCGDGRRISIPFLINGRRAARADANDNFANAPVANT